MELGKIITLDDNKDYLILEMTKLDSKEYLYVVEVDKDDMPTTSYHYLELIHESDGDEIEEVEDKKVIESLTNLFTIKYLNDSIDKNGEQAA